MPIKPPRLELGGVIGIVSPASPPPDPKAIDRAVAELERLGFSVKLGRHVHKRHGFLAGNDRERAADLMRLFQDRTVEAIACVRGGYGCSRLLPLLDYSSIGAHAKIFIGYSDITALHCALLKQANLISFHGPMLNADFADGPPPPFTWAGLTRTLMEATAPGGISQQYNGPKPRVVRGGVACGRLLGGNLSILCTTLGTPYQPSFRNKILFLEELGEAPYRVDRMLTHLLNAGVLQQVSGVAVGTNSNCTDPKAKTSKEYRQTLEDVLQERLRPLKVPVLVGLPFGHIPINATLPVGIQARLDADKGDLVILESAVR